MLGTYPSLKSSVWFPFQIQVQLKIQDWDFLPISTECSKGLSSSTDSRRMKKQSLEFRQGLLSSQVLHFFFGPASGFLALVKPFCLGIRWIFSRHRQQKHLHQHFFFCFRLPQIIFRLAGSFGEASHQPTLSVRPKPHIPILFSCFVRVSRQWRHMISAHCNPPDPGEPLARLGYQREWIMITIPPTLKLISLQHSRPNTTILWHFLKYAVKQMWEYIHFFYIFSCM